MTRPECLQNILIRSVVQCGVEYSDNKVCIINYLKVVHTRIICIAEFQPNLTSSRFIIEKSYINEELLSFNSFLLTDQDRSEDGDTFVSLSDFCSLSTAVSVDVPALDPCLH